MKQASGLQKNSLPLQKTKQKARMTTIFVAGMLCLRNASITVDKTRYVGYKVALRIFTYVLVDFRMSSFHWASRIDRTRKMKGYAPNVFPLQF